MATAGLQAGRSASSAVTKPTIVPNAPPANLVGRVLAPAQLLQLSTSQLPQQQQQGRRPFRADSQSRPTTAPRSPMQPIQLPAQQFQAQQGRLADSCAQQIRHPSATAAALLASGANSSSLSALCRQQGARESSNGQEESSGCGETPAAVTLATSERLLPVWRRSSLSSPPPSSSASSSSSSSSSFSSSSVKPTTLVSSARTKASAHQRQQQAKSQRLESLDNKQLQLSSESESDLFAASVLQAGQREYTADCGLTSATARQNQVSANNRTCTRLVGARPQPLAPTLPPAANTKTRASNRQAHAKLPTTPTKLTSSPATTNSRLRQGALYARRQYHITSAAAAAAAAAVAAAAAAGSASRPQPTLSSATSLGRLNGAKCPSLKLPAASSLSTAQLASTSRASSRTLASVSVFGRARPPSRLGARSVACLAAANLGRCASSATAASATTTTTSNSGSSNGSTGRFFATISASHSSSSTTLSLIQARNSNCRQKQQQQQQHNCNNQLVPTTSRSRLLRLGVPSASGEGATFAGDAGKFSPLSSSTSSLPLGSIKRARPAPRPAREKAAALELEASAIDSCNLRQHQYNRSSHHHHRRRRSAEGQEEMQLQSRQQQQLQLQNQKRPIGLSRRSSNSSSGSGDADCDGGGGSSNVKRLTSLNSTAAKSASLAVNWPTGCSDFGGGCGGGGDSGSSGNTQSLRRQSTPATGNRSTLVSSAAPKLAYLAAATSQAQQRRSDAGLAGAVCNALSYADQRKPAAPVAAGALLARSRSRSDSDSDSGASTNGDDNNNNNNNKNDADDDDDRNVDNEHGELSVAAKSHLSMTSNLMKNITTNSISHNNHLVANCPLSFADKSLSSFANQQQQQHNCQTVCKSIIAAAANATVAAAARDKMKIQSEPIVSTGKDKLLSPSPINIINNNIINNSNNNNNNNNNNNLNIINSINSNQNGIATNRGCPPDIPIRTEPISDYYDLEARPFARGKFAQVKRCINKSTKLCFAAKCIKKRRRLVDIRHEILLEIEALKLSYRTDRIVKLFEVFETQTEMTLILEMATGGELQRVLDEEEVIDEQLVKRMIRQILEGLVELHDIDIAHLDIKPQNLLLTKSFPNGDIKLCDFGISRRITKDCEIREICGTPDYVAPEILSYDPISLATDMWSLGVLTYVLLSGYSPFGSEDKQQTFCNITQATLDFPSEIFEKISDEAIDFMRKLILREPSERLTSRQAKNHPWLNSGAKENELSAELKFTLTTPNAN